MDEKSQPQTVFVYGSLMRGLELHRHIERGTFAGYGYAKGVLVSLGRYPGFIDGNGTVRGELYRFDDLPAALDILDDIEEFDATDPERSLYRRVVRTVTIEDGAEAIAWLYVYNQSTQGAPRVAGGDWRRSEDARHG